jgi:hypothetical protein
LFHAALAIDHPEQHELSADMQIVCLSEPSGVGGGPCVPACGS